MRDEDLSEITLYLRQPVVRLDCHLDRPECSAGIGGSWIDPPFAHPRCTVRQAYCEVLPQRERKAAVKRGARKVLFPTGHRNKASDTLGASSTT